MFVEYRGKIHSAKKKRGTIILDLSEKKISYIPEVMGLKDLVELQEFNLRNNKILKIDGLDHLVNLKILNLSHNQIRDIEGLEYLVNLQELDLSFNKIYRLKGLEKLKNLKILNISFNKVRKIAGLGNLQNLEELTLKKNLIDEITGLEKLTSLKTFNLLSNPILKLASKKFGGDKSGIFKHPENLVSYCRKLSGLSKIDNSEEEGPNPEKIKEQEEKNKFEELERESDARKKKLQRLHNLFDISERVKISDVTTLIDLTREGLLDFLVLNHDKLGGIKIDGDFLKVSLSDVDNFMDLLDKQFESWSTKEKTKEGKIIKI